MANTRYENFIIANKMAEVLNTAMFRIFCKCPVP